MENVNQSNYLGKEKLSKLLSKFAIPCILSLIISCLCLLRQIASHLQLQRRQSDPDPEGNRSCPEFGFNQYVSPNMSNPSLFPIGNGFGFFIML